MYYLFFVWAFFCLLSFFCFSVSEQCLVALASASFCHTVGDWHLAALASASFCHTAGDWCLAALALASFCHTAGDWRLTAFASASFWHRLRTKVNDFVSKRNYPEPVPFLSGFYSFKFSLLLLASFKQTLLLSSEIHNWIKLDQHNERSPKFTSACVWAYCTSAWHGLILSLVSQPNTPIHDLF